MTKKKFWWRLWPRFLLWAHVIGVVGFYIVLWRRTAPGKNDRVKELSLKSKLTMQPTASPLVSIILPARDEEHNIHRCVESLLEQDYDNFEVTILLIS